MEQSNDTNQFETIMAEYNACKLDFEACPKPKVEKGKTFDVAGYQTSEASRVKMDIAFGKLVALRQKDIPFLSVFIEQGVMVLTYNPFGDYLDNLEEMTYEYVEVDDKKTKAYTNAAKDAIKWYIKKMSGCLNLLFKFKLSKWFTDKNYNLNSDLDEFCKEVSMIIRYYPHVDMKNNEDYLAAFFEWFSQIEEDSIKLMNIYDGIINNLKMCLYKDSREKFEKEGTLEDEVRMFEQKLSIQDCSKVCHAKFIKLRIGSEKKKNFLDSIKANGLLKKAMIEKKLNSMTKQVKNVDVKPTEAVKNALDRKRKREENEDGSDDDNEPPAKKQKYNDKTEED